MTELSDWPLYSDDEIAAVTRVLRSNRVNYWTGDEGREFERQFASWCGVRHAVALANGTLALDSALIALGIREGDEVVVTPRSFIASASCVVNAGATPVFADVDRQSGNITVRTIEEALTPRTRAIICVHLGGWPCDMPALMSLARQRNLAVIEDCAQAHGARCGVSSVGTFGDVGAWSFCQDKIMTTGGEGGMVTTQDSELWSRMWSYKDHGKSWEAVYERKHAPGYRWLHESFGTNWRMLEVQAAIGLLQLRKMPEWTKKRTHNARQIADACAAHPALRVPYPPSTDTHAFYRLYAYVEPRVLRQSWSRDRIISELNVRGAHCSHGSCPEVYLERAFTDSTFRRTNRLPVARELGETSVSFHVHPTLTETELQRTCDAIGEVLVEASR